MSIKFASFDNLTRQQKITLLTQMKQKGTQRKEDYFVALHAMIDDDVQVRMAAKMVHALFSNTEYFLDVKGLAADEIREKIETTFSELRSSRPELIEKRTATPVAQLAKDLQGRIQRAERTTDWDGPFPKNVMLLNTLRDDTQGMITDLLEEGEVIDRAEIACFHEPLKPFRDCKRSLDSTTTVSVVNLNHAKLELSQYPSTEALVKLLKRPVYFLVLLTNRRFILFVRDEVQSQQAAVRAIPFNQIKRVGSLKARGGVNLELDLGADLVVVPQLPQPEGLELERLLRERSIASIQADESFIERDFDKELNRLEMLYRAKAITNAEYVFRKQRLKKMELEKFSDKNIEAMLAKRFSDASLGAKIDAELLKRFTAVKTIMFTDIVGYSKKAAEKMLLDTVTLLAVHDKLLMPVLNKHQGQLIKKIGDALMVKFDTPVAACQAGAEMQAALIQFNRTSAEKILIRIGINTGTVFIKNQDIFGDAVNVAARMESMARPGMIFLTEATFQQLAGAIPCTDCGEHEVKGQKHGMRVYALIDETNADQEMIAQARELGADAGDTGPAPATKPAAHPAAVAPSPTPLTPPSPGAQPGPAGPATTGASAPAHAVPAPAAPLPPATAAEAWNQMVGAINQAVRMYKAAVKLGAPRQPAIENHFGELIKTLQKKS